MGKFLFPSVFLSFLVALLVFQGISSAQSKSLASSIWEEGISAFSSGDYQTALVKFEKAYSIWPVPNALYNIAQCQYILKQYESSLKTYRQLLNEGGDHISEDKRRDVISSIQKVTV